MKIKLLLVEDEVITAMSLQYELELLGYDVCEPIVNGEDAILAAIKEKPSLILMDINLIGGIDGIDTIKRIYEKKHIPVIYMSGYSTNDIKERAMATQPLAYLGKPVNANEIKSILDGAH